MISCIQQRHSRNVVYFLEGKKKKKKDLFYSSFEAGLSIHLHTGSNILTTGYRIQVKELSPN